MGMKRNFPAEKFEDLVDGYKTKQIVQTLTNATEAGCLQWRPAMRGLGFEALYEGYRIRINDTFAGGYTLRVGGGYPYLIEVMVSGFALIFPPSWFALRRYGRLHRQAMDTVPREKA